MASKHEQNAKIFKAFSDEKRLAIIEMLRNNELCACDIRENLTIGQSTLSHHMRILCESGVVTSRRESKWTYYSISTEGSSLAIDLLKQLTTMKTD